jgi:hypothetical protein
MTESLGTLVWRCKLKCGGAVERLWGLSRTPAPGDIIALQEHA